VRSKNSLSCWSVTSVNVGVFTGVVVDVAFVFVDVSVGNDVGVFVTNVLGVFFNVGVVNDVGVFVDVVVVNDVGVFVDVVVFTKVVVDVASVFVVSPP
jgi:hypothetical protein